MSLREDTFYIRLSTWRDLVDDATLVEIVERLHELCGRPFELLQDLGARALPRPLTAELMLDRLHSLVGGGLHQLVRLRLSSAQGTPVRSLEINAGPHPYTGAFVTHLDLRVERAWMVRNGASARKRLRKLFEELVALTLPYQAHAHDTDDNAMQNMASASLLKRGYGVEVDPERWSLDTNPGRELSRGAFRYCVNWLTLLGPGLVDHLGVDRVLASPDAEVRELTLAWEGHGVARTTLASRFEEEGVAPRWLLLTLPGDPLDMDALRPAQRAVQEHLGLRELAADERRSFGYWQRR